MYLIACVVAAYLTLFLHELSHVIVSKAVGWTITAFRPWPHRCNGRWWFGRYESVWQRDYEIPAASRWRHIAPLVKTCVAAPAWTIAAIWLHPIFVVPAIWEALDATWWWIGYFSGDALKDGARWRLKLR